MQRTALLFVSGILCASAAVACGDDDASTTDGPTGGQGSGGNATGGTTAASSDLPCEVFELLNERCGQCHSDPPKFGAPMPLVTKAHLTAQNVDGNGTVAETVIARMQSPTDIMPPPPNPPATPAEIAIVTDWIADGMPTKDPGDNCQGTGGTGGMPGVDCTPDVNLAPAEPFAMPSTSIDEQVCFGITIPAADAKRHITTIVPQIDNDTILHHILLLQSPTPVPPEPTSCGFTSIDWKLLYAWGPGTPAHVLPTEAGFPIDAGEEMHFVLQIHYNNLQGLDGQLDASGVDLCTTQDVREHDADIMAFGNIGFGGIAPNATSELDCNMPIPNELAPFMPISIFQSWPHMHQIGRAQYSAVEHASGGTSVLADVPNYDFDYQITYPNENIELNVGDNINVRCTWENSSPTTVGFGEDTADEMCFNFVSYYPRIDVPQWNWLLPSVLSTCNMSQP